MSDALIIRNECPHESLAFASIESTWGGTLSCGLITGVGTISSYLIEWRIDSVEGGVVFTSGYNTTEYVNAIHPFTNACVCGGDLYATIKYIIIDGIRYSPYFREGQYSPDLLSCLGSISVDTNKDTYVPYIGAIKDVDLGIHKISAKGQLIPLFNGACVIPTILDNGDGSITVGDGEYHLSTRTDGKGTNNYIITGGVFSLTDNTTNYLVADYNGGSPIVHVITDVNLINETTVVPIYTAYRSGTILHFQNWDALGVALANKVHQSIVKTQRYRRESGLGVSEFPTRYLSVGNGKVWVGAVPVSVDAISTNTDNMFLFYHSGGVWTVSVQSQYNNTQYDNGTNLVTLTANRYAVNWLFRGVESQKHLYVVLGRGDYTLAQAQEAVLPAIPTAISSHAMLIGKLIVQNGATTATSIQSAFDTQFSTATPNAHNDLTGRDVVDVHPASSVTYTPTGNISSTNVQSAIAELDSEKASYLLTSGWIPKWDGTKLVDHINPASQALSGTTVAWNVNSGIHATITLSGNTTITLSNLVSGTSGNLSVTNPATLYTLTVSGYTNKISPSAYLSSNQLKVSGSSKLDIFSWYYDGTYLWWNGGQDYK